MTQGSKQIETYYTIKIGNAFVREIKIGGGYSNQKVYLKDLSLTQYEVDIKKWCFDSLAFAGTEDDQRQEKYFKEALELLKDNGMNYKVLKTTIMTTEEQKEVSFKDGKESNRKGFSEGGLAGESGRLAVLHNDFVLNKGDAEKLFQSAKQFGQNISEVLDSYVEFAKQGDKEDEEVPDIFDSVYAVCIQAIKDTDEKKATELTASLLKALNRNKNLK